VTRRGLLRSSAVFSGMTLLSRLAGFARDILQASLFGASALMDAFVIAYRIPNYLRRIFAEGSFSSAFVPAYSALKEQGDREAVRDFLDHVAAALCAVVLVVAALGMLAAPWIATVFAPGALDQPGQIDAIAAMLRVTFPYLVFISMTALAGAVLNSHGRFGLAAVTPVLHNVAMITAMLALAPLFDRVLATEMSKTSVRAAHTNLTDNDIGNVTMVRMASEEISDALAGGREYRRMQGVDLAGYRFSTLFVDPPRAGLDDGTIALAKGFDHILYISCNPETMAANIAQLADTHRIERCALFDHFPYTHHMEAGVLLVRRS